MGIQARQCSWVEGSEKGFLEEVVKFLKIFQIQFQQLLLQEVFQHPPAENLASSLRLHSSSPSGQFLTTPGHRSLCPNLRLYVWGCLSPGFLGSRITADGDCSHEIKRYLLLGRKAMTNLDSELKSKGMALLTKVHLVKALVSPVVIWM